MPIISLLTDYGNRDGYVGAVKGVILGLAPGVTIVDVTHEIEACNIAHGAFVLRQVWPWFPAGTIHVAIVDPGVGSERRILAAQYGGSFVVAPDNGLLTWVHRDFDCQALHAVEDRRFFLPQVSSTFHGRDIMAPVAAHLANGVPLESFGPVCEELKMLPVPAQAEVTREGLRAVVVYVDRFGNLVTNLRREQSAQWLKHRVRVCGEDVGPVKESFHDVPVGVPVAYFGSSGLLEIAINQGRAADRYGPDPSLLVWTVG